MNSLKEGGSDVGDQKQIQARMHKGDQKTESLSRSTDNIILTERSTTRSTACRVSAILYSV